MRLTSCLIFVKIVFIPYVRETSEFSKNIVGELVVSIYHDEHNIFADRVILLVTCIVKFIIKKF